MTEETWWTATDPTRSDELSTGPGPSSASLVQIHGPDLGRRYMLTGPTHIGRDASNAIVTDLPGVSRRHAQLVEREGGWWVSDLGSTNGTYLGGSELTAEVRMTSGDQLMIGGVIFKFLAGGDKEALYHEEIYRLTIIDGLTGLHNRRSFMDTLDREMGRARRRGRRLWVAMLDIDHFKALNDTHGHVTGDHVLAGVARLLGAEVRADEVVARFGGEEFSFILPEAERDEVTQFCERIRRLVEDHAFDFAGTRLEVTVSIGAAQLEPNDSIEDLIRSADAELYRAKQAGRNRTAVRAPPADDRVSG